MLETGFSGEPSLSSPMTLDVAEAEIVKLFLLGFESFVGLNA
jgi:hypothetical protein